MQNIRISKEKRLAVLMAVLTVIFCLVIADGILGTNGHAYSPKGLGTYEDTGGSYYYNDHTGEIFFWVSMVLLTCGFAFAVPWRDTWVNLVIYYVLYLPVALFFRGSPQHSYLFWHEHAGIIQIGPNLSFILRPIYVPVLFWLIQSGIYLVILPLKASMKWFVKQRKERTL